ncbi:hypothetical protein A0H81_12279 [Grifola frondosa]|uniref:Uncharacterized protein n=1 Tax=Grifola frondosa TaxID=5627 RepID=A0A1C7LT69_GRIFR|nr:hypothetical protein A0H81_12279 [Grifola frondosa]
MENITFTSACRVTVCEAVIAEIKSHVSYLVSLSNVRAVQPLTIFHESVHTPPAGSHFEFAASVHHLQIRERADAAVTARWIAIGDRLV